MVLAVANTGANDHMCPEHSAFISYHPVPRHSLNIQMGCKTLAPVLGKVTSIISLNGKLVLVCNVLHVHTLRTSSTAFTNIPHSTVVDSSAMTA